MQSTGIQVVEDAGLTAAVDKAARAVRDQLAGTVYSQAELVMVRNHRTAYRDANPPK